jgi:hypothetical protein
MISEQVRRTRTWHNHILAGAWMAAILCSLITLPAPASSNSPVPVLQPTIHLSSRQARKLERKYGIELMSLRLTSAGYMVDFRYRVLNEKKAEYLMRKDIKPYLMDPETGKKLYVPSHPKVGPMRAVSQEAKPGRSYFILFSNTEGVITTGKTVTIVIGDLKIKGLTVQ